MKPANANLRSSVFSQDDTIDKRPTFKPRKTCIMKSSVFMPPTTPARPASNNRTYISNLNGQKILSQGKKQIMKAKESSFKDSSCEVGTNSNPGVYSSDAKRSEMGHRYTKSDRVVRTQIQEGHEFLISSGKPPQVSKHRSKGDVSQTYKSDALSVSNDPPLLWSCDQRPSSICHKSRTVTNDNNQSKNFKEPPTACIWSSDFKPASFIPRNLS